jgi:hypothetical protein
MESDKTMDEGVGMRLELEGKRALIIGTENLELHGAYGSLGECPCKRVICDADRGQTLLHPKLIEIRVIL